MVDPIYDLILGNIQGVRPNEADRLGNRNVKDAQNQKLEEGHAVQTRSQSKEGKSFQKLKVLKGLEISKEEFKDEQKKDKSLSWIRKKVETGEQKSKRDIVSWFGVKNELIYRYFKKQRTSLGTEKIEKQLVVPDTVIKLAHDSILGGHLGIKKTGDKIRLQFFWPGLQQDVKFHCLSCDLCQRTFPKGRVTKVPLEKMPLIETPFERVAIDLVGPIHPITKNKNRYILTLTDYTTRYPEAVPLSGIEAERVAETLFGMFTR